MNILQKTYWTIGAVGWDNVPLRVWHVLEDRLGLKRFRLPAGNVPPEELASEFVRGYDPDQAAELWHEKRLRFFVPANTDQLRAELEQVGDGSTWASSVSSVVAGLRRGRVPYFSHTAWELGIPPDFQWDPVHHVAWPTGQHWSEYRSLGNTTADIKFVWEPSRFAAAFYCAREHVRWRESDARDTFWELLAAWDAQNPYGSTVNWVCGQEAALRLMAWLFAALVTHDGPRAGHPPVEASRYHRLTELVWHTGRHLEKNILYARSQKNNHALSEAVGLWTIGQLFPELRRASAWCDQGRRILVQEVQRQIYDDGSFVQHSLNYHRLMLDLMSWAVRLGQVNGDGLIEIQPRLERALEWLISMISPDNGRVPNYGANDGARMLPLSCCDYLDYRPTAQAMSRMLGFDLPFASGPWDEQALWMCGASAARSSASPGDKGGNSLRTRESRGPGSAKLAGRAATAGSSGLPTSGERQVSRKRLSAQRTVAAISGGYYSLCGPKSWGLIRAHSYCDRPSQADMLHFDLWYGGDNVLRDGGSFSYHTKAPWQSYFPSTAAHNTIEIDGQSQMEKGPRFLWLRWTRSHLHEFGQAADGSWSWFDAEHDGYCRLGAGIVHRRRIVRCEDSYLVVDDVTGGGEHDVALRWRLYPTDWQAVEGADTTGFVGVGRDWELGISLELPPGMSTTLHCGTTDPQPEGWESLYYGERHAVPTLVSRGRVTLPVRLFTMVGPLRRLSAGCETPRAATIGTSPQLEICHSRKLLASHKARSA